MENADWKLSLSFAPIDTKDHGYGVVCVDAEHGKEDYTQLFGLSPENELVLMTAQVEYIERLNQLQQEIASKYNPLLQLRDQDVESLRDYTKNRADGPKTYPPELEQQLRDLSRKYYEYDDVLFYT